MTMRKKNVLIVATVRSGHNFVREQIESWDKDNKFLIANFEDLVPEEFEKRKHDVPAGGAVIDYGIETLSVVVVRDLLNWFASYLKWLEYFDLPQNHDKAIYIWESIAKEAFGLTNYLPQTTRVVYDQFVKIEEARRWTCYYLGGTFTDEKLDHVPEQGRGSSFDGTGIRGSSMRTNERWMQVLNSGLQYSFVEGLKRNKSALRVYKMFFVRTPAQNDFLKTL